jgi:hypothetical protein
MKAPGIDTNGMGRVLALPYGEGLRPFLCPRFTSQTCVSASADSVCSGYCGEIRAGRDAPRRWRYVFCQYAPSESNVA